MRHLGTILLHFIILFCCFLAGRCCFIIANAALVETATIGGIAKAFIYALRLDLSAACYIMALPMILLSLHCISGKKQILTVLKIYISIVIFAYALVVFADIAVYSEWSTKLNYKALVYLRHPTEIVKSASTTHTLTVIFGTLLFAAAFIIIYLKFAFYFIDNKKFKKNYILAAILLIVGEPLLFAGIRGGFQQIPISQSAVYYSKFQVLNDSAVNPAWNLIHSILNFSKLNNSNPYICMEPGKAEAIVSNLLAVETDTTIKVLNSTPENVNVVIILLESWSADLIESLSGEKGITPFFHELEKEGLLFTNFYANGHRSQLGISALLSGFPPVPDLSITDNLEKYPKLNSIIKDVNGRYSTSFWFGGDLTYGNLRTYLMSNQFDVIHGEEDFPKDLPRGKLSIFDRYSLDYYAKELNKEKKPFFSIFFTASTHSPYDEPKEVEQLTWDCTELQYLNSAKYTDDCLRQFFETVENEEWYKNTLFILVADHSHTTHLKRDYYSSEYQHVPMLWIGEVLNDGFRGKTIDKYCSHIDISKTLLNQLGFDASQYIWSQDIMNPYAKSATPVELPGGLGWISSEGYIRYDGHSKTYPTIRGYDNPQALDSAKTTLSAYLQMLYQQYLDM
ncbi:MAG: sulfatase-like hydrolase/transferase [Bacteroidales bacterium]|nr:sulfatase-like hydrolase/transferase [Bacteroidales bacterium]